VAAARPAGRVASTVHRGRYDRLGDAHAALAAWCERSGRAIGAASWEIYGDWGDDPARREALGQRDAREASAVATRARISE
jgi:hypothetical protein